MERSSFSTLGIPNGPSGLYWTWGGRGSGKRRVRGDERMRRGRYDRKKDPGSTQETDRIEGSVRSTE